LVSNCEIVYSDVDLPIADAVVFHLHKLTRPEAREMNKLGRESWQRWVWLTDESPPNTKFFEDILQKGVFNWSMNYHSTSDVPVPYGRVIPKKSTNQEGKDEGEEVLRDFYHEKKKKGVALLASNCGGTSGRYSYLDKLLKHLAIDVWGPCGKRYNMSMTCAGHFMRDCPDLDDYKFYLAFENSLCSEYITEKVWWNSYSKGAVPIVMGGLSERDYSRLAPPNSYLHVDQFEGPEHLAAKVKYLLEKPEEYNKYHAWRIQFTVLNEHGYFGAPIRHYCRLCEALNYNKEEKLYEDLTDSWSRFSKCRKGFERNLKRYKI